MLLFPCFIPASPDWPSFLPTQTEFVFLYLEVKREGTQSLGLLAVEKILEEGREGKKDIVLGWEEGGGGSQS